jgi:hypothetical protein
MQPLISANAVIESDKRARQMGEASHNEGALAAEAPA